jgi:hypothetical protein
MLNPMSMELLAEQVQREHFARVAHAALLAQLPRPTTSATSETPRFALAPSLASVGNALRLHLANALRVLATWLDPSCAACDQGLVRIVNSR